jgi:apolipoprotein N-acyltransferase
MSVFRAVENKRTVVRATNGGITCTIEPDGRITSMIDPFVEAYLVNDVPVYDDVDTLYTRWGDWLALVFLGAAGCALILGIVLAVTRKDTR